MIPFIILSSSDLNMLPRSTEIVRPSPRSVPPRYRWRSTLSMEDGFLFPFISTLLYFWAAPFDNVSSIHISQITMRALLLHRLKLGRMVSWVGSGPTWQGTGRAVL